MMKRETTEKKGNLLRIFALALALVFVLCVIGTYGDFAGIGGGNREILIEIPSGAGADAVAHILDSRGIISHPLMFKLWYRIEGAPIFQQGRHRVHPSMSYREIFKKLSSAPDQEGSGIKKVAILEGYELRQVVDLLVEKGLGNEAVFWHEIESGVFDIPFVKELPQRENRLEGYLYPDTYLFTVGETEHAILEKMLRAFEEKVLPVYQEANPSQSLDEIIKMASVVEREAANVEEQPIVASVFYNRLAKNMRLESCATVQYILRERKLVLSIEDTQIDSPYNTYRNQGLPVGPIATPGLSSVKAALYPAETNYLYFLATKDGEKNLFSETFEEHQKKLVETQGD